MPIKSIHTEAELSAEFQAASSKLVVVEFFAEWCQPCQQIAPYIDNLSRELRKVCLFLKVDMDASNDLALKYGVKAMPTFLLFRAGILMDEIEGTDMNQLEATMAKYLYVS